MKDYVNEKFLMSILNFYSENTEQDDWILSRTAIHAAVNKTLEFLNTEDKVNTTNHAKIFKVCMVEQKITVHNCTTIGISRRTFYRYKQRYLKIFGTYLQQFSE